MGQPTDDTGNKSDDMNVLHRKIHERQQRIDAIRARLAASDQAQRLEKQWTRNQSLRFTGVVIGVVVVISGAAWAYPEAETPRFGHEHSVFRFFVDDGEISFEQPYFDFSRTGNVRAHLHLSGPESTQMQYVIHAEGELPISLGLFFATLGVQIRGDRVTLDPGIHEGRSIANNSTHSWQLWSDACKDDTGWVRQAKFRDHEPGQFERMAIVYAAKSADAASLAPLFDKVPSHHELQLGFGQLCPGAAKP